MELVREKKYVIKKGKKFLKNYGYSTLRGNRFFWTHEIKNAVVYTDLQQAQNFSIYTNGKLIILDENTEPKS